MQRTVRHRVRLDHRQPGGPEREPERRADHQRGLNGGVGIAGLAARSRQGECLRLIYDELREAAQPVTTRELAERVMRVKAIPAADDRQRELIQKTLLGSLNRAKETIERVETAGVVSWRLI